MVRLRREGWRGGQHYRRDLGDSKSVASGYHQHIVQLGGIDLARLDPDFTNVGHHQTESQSTHFAFSVVPTEYTECSHTTPAPLFAETSTNVDNTKTLSSTHCHQNMAPSAHHALRPRNNRRSIADFLNVRRLSTLVPIHDCGWLADSKYVLWLRGLAIAFAPNDTC
jgi:hypothetical protein